jgi:hypothetical protein
VNRKESIEEAMIPWFAPHMGPQDMPQAILVGIEAGLAWEPKGSDDTGPRWEADHALDIVLRYISEQRSWRLRRSGPAGSQEYELLKEKTNNILAAWESRNRGRGPE